MVALLRGPLVLFPINVRDKTYTAEQLLGARQQSASDWVVATVTEPVELKPFMFIGCEQYSLYMKLI